MFIYSSPEAHCCDGKMGSGNATSSFKKLFLNLNRRISKNSSSFKKTKNFVLSPEVLVAASQIFLPITSSSNVYEFGIFLKILKYNSFHFFHYQWSSLWKRVLHLKNSLLINWCWNHKTFLIQLKWYRWRFHQNHPNFRLIWFDRVRKRTNRFTPKHLHV